MEWRLFADLAELAGERHVTVEETPTAEAAFEALLAAHPPLEERVLEDGSLADHITVLRNGEALADLSVELEADDELALMPPVSGG